MARILHFFAKHWQQSIMWYCTDVRVLTFVQCHPISLLIFFTPAFRRVEAKKGPAAIGRRHGRLLGQRCVPQRPCLKAPSSAGSAINSKASSAPFYSPCWHQVEQGQCLWPATYLVWKEQLSVLGVLGPFVG